MKIKISIVLFLCIIAVKNVLADEYPIVSPTVSIIDSEGKETTGNYDGSAPATASFYAQPTNAGGWTAYYEWRFMNENDTVPYLIRYEENTKYTFTKSGTHNIVLYAKFTNGNNIIEQTSDPITVTLSTSKLEMPNAFSPNGDGINDIYKAKNGYQSIIEFHAYIFNRWGQKLYEWNDINDGWNGKFKGKDVKDGVYFVLVRATGADGKKYNIKRDVNLLRGYTESDSSNNE
jgi:gliding motility-associated-like protein